jgi:hypothetical protein
MRERVKQICRTAQFFAPACRDDAFETFASCGPSDLLELWVISVDCIIIIAAIALWTGLSAPGSARQKVAKNLPEFPCKRRSARLYSRSSVLAPANGHPATCPGCGGLFY